MLSVEVSWPKNVHPTIVFGSNDTMSYLPVSKLNAVYC